MKDNNGNWNMRHNQFRLRLSAAVSSGSLQSCLDLSNEIHQAEEKGYELSPSEEQRWAQLTDKILKLQAKGKHQ